MSKGKYYYFQAGGGVTFIDPDTDNKICHTYDDHGLILRSAYPSTPVPKTNYLDIPGRDGSIDLTEALGGVKYEDRYLYITLTDLNYKLSVGEKFALLERQIDGRRVKVILDKIPAFYFIGRVTSFSDPEIEGMVGTTTITVRIEPYRYSIYDSNNPWLWDPFNFLTDMAIEDGNYIVSGMLRKDIIVGQSNVIPTITVSSDMTLEFEGRTYELKPGVTYSNLIELVGNKENILIFRGNGTVKLDYRGGRF